MKEGFSQQEIERTAGELGLPTNQPFIQCRIARAFSLLESNKVTEVTEGIFRVWSQEEPNLSYIVNLNHGEPACNCPDGERTIYCKHRIASMFASLTNDFVLWIVRSKRRTEHNNDDGDDTLDWQVKIRECQDAAVSFKRYDWLKSDLQREGQLSGEHPKKWQDSDFLILKKACKLDTSLHNCVVGDFMVVKERNDNDYDYSRRYRFWLVTKDTEQLREKCFWCGKVKSQVVQLSDELGTGNDTKSKQSFVMIA